MYAKEAEEEENNEPNFNKKWAYTNNETEQAIPELSNFERKHLRHLFSENVLYYKNVDVDVAGETGQRERERDENERERERDKNEREAQQYKYLCQQSLTDQKKQMMNLIVMLLIIQ